MLVVTVEFLNETYRADSRGLAATGALDVGEWPPSPLRLLSALVAADGTGDRCRWTDGSELSHVEQLPPPAIYASPPDRVHHQALETRFVVSQTGRAETGKMHQEYLARKGAVVRPGVRVAPACPTVVFAWDDDPSEEIVEALRVRAARVGYLGTADSPARVTVSTHLPAGLPEPFVPEEGRSTAVRVPAPGVLRAMDAHYERWRELGPSVTSLQSPGLRRFASYRLPGEDAGDKEKPLVIWLRVSEPVSGRRVSALTGAFKAALLARYDTPGADVPSILHGHGYRAAGYEIARYLALPDVGYPRSTGRIHGLAVWLPPGTENVIVDQCRDALGRLHEIRGPGVRVNVGMWAGEERPRAANPARWVDRSTRWSTAFPVVFERHVPTLGLDDVAAWCEHAGLPRPVAFRSARHPFLAGGVDLAPVEVHREGRPRRPYCHLDLVFDEPVQGPVVVGAARQRGLGLCVPVHGETSRHA